ncbi:uncharacterized protein SAPINGB_P003087 [Magnusiomyces paraingens]|uniref:NADH-cytochrome b5 reductase n=1 Tax=Magnusiomyces paraingens TaxID=2606893 RepID=A0A5E8BJI5_9ASCO|nr:uncharacterized protein SAPINGB_P003087 [Saprochaete ingens]VVT51411.1 unnamed protein product [Saprochaete ingens]
MVFPTAIRQFAASAKASAPLKSSAWGPAIFGASLAIGSYFYYSSRPVAAESTLKGDKQWVDLKLIGSEELTSNTREFTFELPAGEKLGLTPTSALLAKYVTAKGNNVIRPYTPVNDLDDIGTFKLVIKRYETGKFGNHIFALKNGDTVAFQGPIPKYPWTANKHAEVGLIGGGSGITPLYQLIHAIDKDPADKTKVHLFYGNVTDNDIILKKELEEVAAKNPEQFKFHFFVDKASDSWKGETGYITKEYLEKNLFASSADNVKVFVCGPPPFSKAISGPKVSPTDQGEVEGALKDLGFSKDQVFKF